MFQAVTHVCANCERFVLFHEAFGFLFRGWFQIRTIIILNPIFQMITIHEEGMNLIFVIVGVHGMPSSSVYLPKSPIPSHHPFELLFVHLGSPPFPIISVTLSNRKDTDCVRLTWSICLRTL